MAIAYDAITSSGYGSSVDGASWTHTPTGTPKGVIVFVVNLGSTDFVTGVTYGGVAMSQVAGSPLAKATGETFIVYCFFLGAGITAGNQTVAVSWSGNQTRECLCISLVAAGNTEVVDTTTISSDSVIDPSATLSLGGFSCFCVEMFGSRQTGVEFITPFANWTARVEVDEGVKTHGCYTYDVIDTADVTMGWTQTADDAVCIGVAVKELGGGARSYGYIF